MGERIQLVKGPVTTTQVVMYAGASGDFNRIHYDQRFAREAGLDDVIAHGMLTMGFAGQLVTEWCGAGGRVEEISARFLLPVRIGDKVTLTGTVEESVATAGGIRVRVSLSGETPRGVVLAGSAVVLLP